VGISRVGIFNPTFEGIKDFLVKDDDGGKPRMNASDHFAHAQGQYVEPAYHIRSTRVPTACIGVVWVQTAYT